ncbi:MAG: ABC transporter ATP-binding protein [Chitinispirillia bacterium]|nr:ABC transporter ATP-binding protein [Chitinispirillia bacterium]
MPALEAKNLFFAYKGKTVLENISLTINNGETWAVIGRNGAGKSTLLKCLCALLKPSSGSIFIDGISISKLSPKEIAKIIAYVPQGSAITAPPFTVREYVMMARFPYRTFASLPSKDDKKRVDESLSLTGIGHLSDRMMDTLSGGELQTALLAGAIAQGTSFLLLDEPTTYLDPCHQENIRTVIERIRARGDTSVITVTHDVNFALSCHDSILALVNAKTEFCGKKKLFCIDASEHLSKIFSVKFGVTPVYDNQQRMIYFTQGGAL